VFVDTGCYDTIQRIMEAPERQVECALMTLIDIRRRAGVRGRVAKTVAGCVPPLSNS
jgi:hypothetical protein